MADEGPGQANNDDVTAEGSGFGAATDLDWQAVLRWAREGNPEAPRRVEKTEDEWRAALSAERFAIARRAGTERPFSSEMCSAQEAGRYACVCCETPLFESGLKYDSGSGWPSFTAPVVVEVVAYHLDESHGMQRVEVTCNVCDAHLGHVFPDGPAPTGLRYCTNGASLKKVAI